MAIGPNREYLQLIVVCLEFSSLHDSISLGIYESILLHKNCIDYYRFYNVENKVPDHYHYVLSTHPNDALPTAIRRLRKQMTKNFYTKLNWRIPKNLGMYILQDMYCTGCFI